MNTKDIFTEIIQNIRRFGIESVFRRYYARYEGRVVDIDDPKKLCRVKLVVPSLFGDETLANWAMPIVHAGKSSSLFGIIGKPSSTSNKFCSFFAPPKKDDWVWVEFQRGHPSFPIYSPMGWFGKGDRPAMFDDASDWNMMNPIFISRFGHQIYVDESSGKAKFVLKMNNGNLFTIDETSGSEKIEIKTERGAYWRMTLNPDMTNSDLGIVIGGKLTESYGQAVSSTYKMSRTVEIGSNETVSVKLNGDYKWGGSFKGEVTGSYDLKCTGYTVKSNAAATIESSATATIKGSTQVLGGGGHPIPYGDTLKKALDTFCDALSGLTPGSPANNAQSVAKIMQAAIQLKQGILMMNSQRSTTD